MNSLFWRESLLTSGSESRVEATDQAAGAA